MAKARCTVKVAEPETGLTPARIRGCGADPTQRIITGSMITHRCAEHAVGEDEAAANGWRVFTIAAAEERPTRIGAVTEAWAAAAK